MQWIADQANRINTRDVWKNQFASWAQTSEANALATARQDFRPVAADVLQRRCAELRRDRERLQDWLESRAREITADRGLFPVAQELPGLGQRSQPQPTTAPWARLADPVERLAGFASDNTQPVALRHEAQTVLTLQKKRNDDLSAREAIRDPEITTLGMLMLVPCPTK